MATKMTIEPQAKLPINMAALLKGLGADVTGDFSEGSVALNFVGTIMPLVGQMTITNPALRLVHESEMVENDPGRTDIPQELDGLWWNISGGRDAQVMVTNTSVFPASADVHVGLGQKEQALASLGEAYADRSMLLTILKVDPQLDSLHSDPRFKDLVRRVGLPP